MDQGEKENWNIAPRNISNRESGAEERFGRMKVITHIEDIRNENVLHSRNSYILVLYLDNEEIK